MWMLRAMFRDLRFGCLSIVLFSLAVGTRPIRADDTAPVWLEQSGRTALEKALRLPADFDAKGLTVDELVKLLRDKYHIQAKVDPSAITGMLHKPGTPLGWSDLRGLSLWQALRNLCDSSELPIEPTVKDGVLLITSPTRESPVPSVVLYPVGDLIATEKADPSGERVRRQYEELVRLLKELAPPGVWDMGSASIHVLPGMLAVRQDESAHLEIERLLDALRAARKRPEQPTGGPEAVKFSVHVGGADRIGAALEKTCRLRVAAVPLGEVVEQLRKQVDVSMRLDRWALKDDADQPVSLDVDDATLETILSRLAEQVDLGWGNFEGVLLLTTRDRAESLLETRIYPLRRHSSDVASGDEGGDSNSPVSEAGDLASAIMGTIGPTTWRDLGGNGVIVELPIFDALW